MRFQINRQQLREQCVWRRNTEAYRDSIDLMYIQCLFNRSSDRIKNNVSHNLSIQLQTYTVFVFQLRKINFHYRD